MIDSISSNTSFGNSNALYRRQGFLRKPVILNLVKQDSFENICKKYGCSDNEVKNVQFIKSQILNKKTVNTHANVPVYDYQRGIVALFLNNKTNTMLSDKDYRKLYNIWAEAMYLPL